MTLPPLPELKPCPFCLGPARVYGNDLGNNEWIARCRNIYTCGTRGCAWLSEAEAIAAWNHRAALAQPPAPTAQPAESATGQPLRSICWANCPCRKAAQPVQQPGAEPLHGGMDNAELLAAWKKKLPGVEPSDAQLTAFAVGVEVGFSHARDLERQDWSRVHHALAKHGVHPGRTDDHLADVIDRALAAPAQRQPLTVPALTDAQMSECAWGYVADSRNLDAGVTGIIQATQLACAAAWGITLAAQKGEKL